MKSSSIQDIALVALPKIQADSGNITAINNNIEVNFSIERCYYLYDVPGGATRAGHAHKNLHQLIIAASGSFNIILDDASSQKTIFLNQPDKGLYLPPGLWRILDNFSSGSICLVLASEVYDEQDYIRDYSDFLKYKNIVK